MIRPLELRDDAAWDMFQAASTGDLAWVKQLATQRPDLVLLEYNYTPPLHFAVREGHLEMVEFLVGQGADAITYRTYPFQETLLTMAQDREHHAVAEFLRHLFARRFPIREGLAEFLQAARDGDWAAIKAALARDASLATASDDGGETALHHAAARGHQGVIAVLLDAGANPDAERADGLRPIHCALRHHGREQGTALARFLLERGSRYNIYLAAVLGDAAYVRQALSRDRALANFEDSSHFRPISAAARRNDLELVKLLLDHGADPSLPEHGAPLGQALWLAVYQKQPEMVKLLLAHGANPNTAPESSGPALLHARHDPEMTRLLIAYGAVEEVRPMKELETLISDDRLEEVERWLTQCPEFAEQQDGFWSEGILAGPANRGNHAMIELLMRFGARVPKVTKWGPEYYFKHVDTAAFLLDRGMDPEHMNWHRFTLLHHMAAKGSLPKARLLVEHGAPIDAVDEEYQSTPLACAARWGHLEMVQFLLGRGADVRLSGARWSTPLAWARKKGHPAIEKELLAAGA